MNKKQCFIIFFLIFCITIIHSTPDRIRYVFDNLIGFYENNMVIHQLIYDNLQSHNNFLEEEYLIEKNMENGITIIVKQIKITYENKIENILLREYNGNIEYCIPDIDFFIYNKQPIINNHYIRLYDELIDLRKHIPIELLNCNIIRIVDIYERYNETDIIIYLTIDLNDTVNIYRKIIMIKINN
jgi:hypothetical protein